MEGVDAVVGPVGSGGKEEFRKLKKSSGSGVLSIAVVPDGPTRVLRITDESKKVSHVLMWLIMGVVFSILTQQYKKIGSLLNMV